jgi:hypothetical protein
MSKWWNGVTILYNKHMIGNCIMLVIIAFVFGLLVGSEFRFVGGLR